VPLGVFRLDLGDRSFRLARGDASVGPDALLPADLTFDELLGANGRALAGVAGMSSQGEVPAGARVVAPIESQEVWAAGVTYLRSREARAEESADATPYDLVYEAERPELFFKSPGWRVRSPGEEIAVRADSAWNTPEPELALVVDARMRIAGYTIGDDVSSRSIEGENPLYLPQAKVYDGSCALGPCVVPADDVQPPFDIELEVLRRDDVAYRGATSTERMKRSFEELTAYLGKALAFPSGAILLTGTGLVPDAPFSLQPSDVVRISIGGLGVLENPVTTAGSREVVTPAARART
jgi:2-dehydro-3-deoxy-D-arabinonate dehydratase